MDAVAQQYAGTPQFMPMVVEELLRQIKEQFQAELIAQGHKLTGGLINSMVIEVRRIGNVLRGSIWADDHAVYVNEGVLSTKIPYYPGSGNKKSDYISGLMEYWRSRGLSNDESKNAAFALATVQKEEGMPTKKSYSFSDNGRRGGFKGGKHEGFIDYTLYEQGQTVQIVLSSVVGSSISILVRKLLRGDGN